MADADSSDPATLLTIPTEIHKAIADVTDNQGLLALRLVNKELHAAVDDSFLERFFTTRRHIMTLHGLSALVEITMRPHLIRKLKEIVLVYMDLEFSNRVIGGSSPNVRQRFLVKDLGEAKWKYEQNTLFRGGRAEHLLRDILQNVMTQCPKLTIADEFRADAAATFGRRLLARTFGLADADIVYSDTPFDVSALLSSIELADYPVRDLDLFITDGNSWCLRDAFEDIDDLFPSPCWVDLRSLSLHLPGSDVYWRVGKDGYLFSFIEAAINIESLRLKIGISDSGVDCSDALGRLGEAFKKHALRDVELHNFETELPQHIGFFRPHQKTLQSVVLSGGVLLFDCWSKVLARFHQDFQLHKIQIEDLSRNTGAGYETMVEEGGRGRVDLRGEEAVRHGLGQLTSGKLRYGDQFLGKVLSQSE